MEGIENLKTDPTIGDILNKLKNAGEHRIVYEMKNTVDDSNDYNTDNVIEEKKDKIVENTEEDGRVEDTEPVCEDEVVDENINVQDIDDPQHDGIDQVDNEYMLPWMNESDLDTELLHYATFNNVGELEYHCINLDQSSDNEIAALKLANDFACEIDYYKSVHYVLSIREDTGPNNTYRLTVVTDLGVAEFSASEYLSLIFENNNYSKWFEEIPNYELLFDASFTPNETVDNSIIKDHKYDIVTMLHPYMFSLDSSESDDEEIIVKVKDEYTIIPLNRILGCIKYYSTSKLKSYDNFRSFINKYFDII